VSESAVVPAPVDIHLDDVLEDILVILPVGSTVTQRFAIDVDVLDGCDFCVQAWDVDVGACVAKCATFYLQRDCDGGT